MISKKNKISFFCVTLVIISLLPLVIGRSITMEEALQKESPTLLKLTLIFGSKKNKEHLNLVLKEAVKLEQVEIIKALGGYVDADVKDEKGNTALLRESRKTHPNIAVMKALVEIGGDINFKGGCDVTPLLWACMAGDPQLLKAIVAMGGNIKAQDNSGFSALHWTIVLHGKVNHKVVECLINLGADLYAEDCYRVTPLFRMIEVQDFAGIELMVKKGINLNARAQHNANALEYAIRWRNPQYGMKLKESTPELIECLIKQGADVNLLGKDGETPLAKAKRLGRTPLVAVLKKYGAK